MTRDCPNCGPLPEDSFAWKNKAKGRRASMCKTCHAAYSKIHYSANLPKYKAKARIHGAANKAANRTLILDFLLTHPCVDCGESDIRVLQFDHRDRKLKRASPGCLLNHSRRVLLLEIAKCDSRCANCHMRRTGNEFGWRLGRGGETRTPNGISPSRA